MGSINVLKTAASALLMAKAITADTTTGPLSILSFNVAGLPSILQDNGESGDKTTNSELIGTYFSEYDYDVIHVQEDFNYHASICKPHISFFVMFLLFPSFRKQSIKDIYVILSG